jgi:glycerol-3-phosphate cytidylyltransferase-like family protein
MEGWRINNIHIKGKRYINGYEYTKHLNKIKKNALVFICNPNNPTGATWRLPTMIDMFKKFRHMTFVVDETYIDFSRIVDRNNSVCSVACLVNDYKNVIVMRSFSKAYGLAGLRLSYMVSNTCTIEHFRKLISHKDVIEIAKTAGSLVIENIEFYRLQIQKMVEEKHKLIQVCNKFRIIYMNADTNFICLKTIKNGGDGLYDIFRKEGMLIKIFARQGSNKYMADWIRITVQANAIDTVIKIIKEYIYLFKTKKYDTGFIDGCFDGFHYGHVMALTHAKEKCKVLKCGTHTEAEIVKWKSKPAIFKLEDREFMINQSIFVDELVATVSYNTDEVVLRNNNAGMFFHGEDGVDKYPLKELADADKLHIYPRTKYISTTILKERIRYYLKTNTPAYEMVNSLEAKKYLDECYQKVLRVKHNIVSRRQDTKSRLIVVAGNFDMFSRKHVEQLISIQTQYNANIIIVLDEIKYKPFIFSIDEQKIIIESCKIVHKVYLSKEIDKYIDTDVVVELHISINDILSELNVE